MEQGRLQLGKVFRKPFQATPDDAERFGRAA